MAGSGGILPNPSLLERFRKRMGWDVPWYSWGAGTYGVDLVRLGKKESGRRLDGETWDEFPTPPALAFA